MEIIVNKKNENATINTLECANVASCSVREDIDCNIKGQQLMDGAINMHNGELSPTDKIKKPYKSSHDPKKPRVFSSVDKLRYHSIEEAKRNLFDSFLNPFKYSFGELFYHRDKNGRKVRSEACEALTTRVGAVLWHYVDLITFQFGMFKNNNQFQYFDYGLIQSKLGASESQVRRTMKRLQDHGYVTVSPVKERQINKSTGEIKYKTKDVIITLTDKFIDALKINNEKLLSDRERAIDKYNDRQSRLDKKSEKLNRLSETIKNKLAPVKKALSKARDAFTSKRTTTSEQNKTPAQNSEYIKEALARYKYSSLRTVSDYLDEIIKKNQAPPNNK